jgi:YfiR/HmsC-like
MQKQLRPPPQKPRRTLLSVMCAALRQSTQAMATYGSPLAFSGARRCASKFIASCLCVIGISAQAAVPPSNAASAGDLSDFILNVSRYAAWPADPSRKTLTICHAHGGASHTGGLATDVPAVVKGLTVVWRAVANVSQVPGCNVLWLNADVRPAPREWLAATHDLPILSISNYADFTADGGIVGAYRVGNDWRFEINLESLQRSKINIAAAALRLSQKPRTTSVGTGEVR